MHTVEWIDSGREPEVAPDPRYPLGKHIDAGMAGESCKVQLPYPARRCGHFVVTCALCSLRTLITTAGRPDDPRSVTLPCKVYARNGRAN